MTTPRIAGRFILSASLLAASSMLAACAATAAAQVAAPIATGLPDFTDLIEKVGPAVINIRTTEKIKLGQGAPGDDEMQEFLRRFFGQQGPRSP